MNIMKRLTWLWLVLLALLATACLKDNPSEGTIVLMGTESDVKPVEQVIPDTFLKFIGDSTAMNMLPLELPTGNIPPDVQGDFIFTPMELFAYNNHHPLPGDTLFFRFYDQHNRMVSCEIHENGFTRESVSNAFLMGKGNAFTAYFPVNYECKPMEEEDFTYKLTRGYLITGKVTSTGIDEALVICINTDVDADENSQIATIGDILSTENDIYVYCVPNGHPFGSAIRYQWH